MYINYKQDTVYAKRKITSRAKYNTSRSRSQQTATKVIKSTLVNDYYKPFEDIHFYFMVCLLTQ